MKKLFLIMMSLLCSSHQMFTMYNPLFAAAIMKGRVAALAAYVGSKAGFISQDDSRPTMWLHEDDVLRWTWLYKESLANIHKKSSLSSKEVYKKESDVASDMLVSDLQKKFEKIVELKKKLESCTIEIGQPHVQAIHTILDEISKCITQLHELQKINLTNELLLKDISDDQAFLSWFHTQKNNLDLLSQVREEREITLRDFSRVIIDDKKLRSLEARIQEIVHAPKLDFSTHVSLARQYHTKEARLYLTALSTYTMDLCACKNAEDYITIGAGGLGFLGFMSLMSKNNSEFSKLAYVGCGGATSLVARKLYYQFLSEQQASVGIDLIQTNLGLAQSRLENLRRSMDDTIFHLCSELNKEFRDYKQDARCQRIEQGVERVNEGVLNLQAGQAVLQSAVTDGFERVEKNQQEQLIEAIYLQQAMSQLKDQIKDLGGDVEKTNALVSSLSLKFDLSEEQFRIWANAESNARNEFEARSVEKLSLLDEIAANSRLQLRLAQASAQQKSIQNSHYSESSIHVLTKIDAK